MHEIPKCDYCDRPIKQRFWYVINGDVICKQCLDENFKVGVNEEEE